MKISILGAGHIGVINGYCLARLGHQIHMVDIDPVKIELFRSKTPFFSEKDLDWDWFFERVSCSSNLDCGLSSLVMVCIDAPVRDGMYEYTAFERVFEECREARLPVLLRSTFGVAEIAALRKYVEDVQCVYWPEFLREGSALKDFYSDPAFVASFDGSAPAFMDELNLPSSYIASSSPESLAATKVFSNAFRAVKTSFANAVGLALKDAKIDIEDFFKIFSALRGNCDDLYLRPGDPFGGFCLPKETQVASKIMSRYVDDSSNIFAATYQFNECYVQTKISEILTSGVDSIIFAGFSFKSGTSDTRNSPYLAIARALQAEGLKVFVVGGDEDEGILDPSGVRVKSAFLRQFDTPDFVKSLPDIERVFTF